MYHAEMTRVYLLSAICLCVMHGVSLAQDIYPELKLKDGRLLKSVTVEAVLPDGLKVTHSEGGGRVGVDLLPDDFLAMYKLNTPEVAKAVLLRKERENQTRQRQIPKVDTYDLVREDLKKTLGESSRVLRKKLADSNASDEELLAFNYKQKSTEVAWMAAVKEAEMSGASPTKCRSWISATLENKPIVGMPLSFVYIAWGKPKQVNLYHNDSMLEHDFGRSPYIYSIKGKNTVVNIIP